MLVVYGKGKCRAVSGFPHGADDVWKEIQEQNRSIVLEMQLREGRRHGVHVMAHWTFVWRSRWSSAFGSSHAVFERPDLCAHVSDYLDRTAGDSNRCRVLVYGSEKNPGRHRRRERTRLVFREKYGMVCVYNERYARRSNVVELFPTLREAIVDTFCYSCKVHAKRPLHNFRRTLWLCFGAAAVIGAERTKSYSCCGSIDRFFQR